MGGFEEILPEIKENTLDNYPSTEMDPNLGNTTYRDKPKTCDATQTTGLGPGPRPQRHTLT